MDMVQLFIAAWTPVLKMLLVTCVGSISASPSVDVLTEEARKQINNIVYYIFNPSIVASNLSQTFTLETLSSTWFMPINILLTFIIGSAFGWILNKITKPPPHLKSILLGCCASGNLGIMLLIIIPSTCYEKESPFGAPDTCHAQAMAYASLSMGINDIVFWSYVYNIVRLSLGFGNNKIISSIDDEELSTEKSLEEGITIHEKDPKFVDSKVSSICEDHIPENFDATSTKPPKINKVQALKTMTTSLYQKPLIISIRRSFTPSTFGVIIGLIVGVFAPFRKALIGGKAPLRAMQGAISLLGDGAVPSTTLIMGGNLAKGFRKSDIKISFVIGVIIVRFLLLPMAGIGIIKGAIHFGLIHPDPLYQFVLLVQYALPPAMNMGLISQLFGVGQSECSIIFFWTYALTLVLFPLWAICFMWQVSSMMQI